MNPAGPSSPRPNIFKASLVIKKLLEQLTFDLCGDSFRRGHRSASILSLAARGCIRAVCMGGASAPTGVMFSGAMGERSKSSPLSELRIVPAASRKEEKHRVPLLKALRQPSFWNHPKAPLPPEKAKREIPPATCPLFQRLPRETRKPRRDVKQVFWAKRMPFY